MFIFFAYFFTIKALPFNEKTTATEPFTLVHPPSISYSNGTMFKHSKSCGGIERLRLTGERCEICGDTYTSEQNSTALSEFFSLRPSMNFKSDTNVNISVKVERYRPGWLEYRICATNAKRSLIDQHCFDKLILNINNVNGTRIYLKRHHLNNLTYTFSIKIPYYVSCEMCILQVKYRCLDTVGIDDAQNVSCEGCGIQEIYQDCALLSIEKGSKIANAESNLFFRDSRQNRSIGDFLNMRFSRIGDYNGKLPTRSSPLPSQIANRANNQRSHQSSMSKLADRLVAPEYDSEAYPPPDRICMSWSEYSKFRETVDLLEYLTYSLKHESLREISRYPESNQQGRSHRRPKRDQVRETQPITNLK